MSNRRRQGFSFLELFIGIVILFCGIIPILWVFSGSTRGAQLTVQQVQATTHATNLMEAIRACGFDLVSQFPPVMMQAEGSKDWKPPGEAAALDWADVQGGAPSPDQASAFAVFTRAFFDSKIMPEMEPYFRRYVVVRGSGSSGTSQGPSSSSGAEPEEAQGGTGGASTDDGMIGVTVRVEWSSAGMGQPDKPSSLQHVELRTVLGNPYHFPGGSQ